MNPASLAASCSQCCTSGRSPWLSICAGSSAESTATVPSARYSTTARPIAAGLQPDFVVYDTADQQAIVRKAMQRMGGRVWAQGEPGRGAVFHLEMPQ